MTQRRPLIEYDEPAVNLTVSLPPQSAGEVVTMPPGHGMSTAAAYEAMRQHQAAAPVSLGRLASASPSLKRRAPEAAIAPIVAALRALTEPERFEAFRIGNRAAYERERAEQFEGKLHGTVDQAALDLAWAHGGGDRRIVALELGTFGFIKRGQVWDCRNQRWTGVEYRNHLKTVFPESFPADYPIMQDLKNQGFRVKPLMTQRDATAGWFCLQITTVDHLLRDIGRRGVGVMRVKAFVRAATAAEVKAQREHAARLEHKGWFRLPEWCAWIRFAWSIWSAFPLVLASIALFAWLAG